MAKKNKWKGDRVRTCHCVIEKDGKHRYSKCYRSKNRANAQLRRDRKYYPTSHFFVKAGFCPQYRLEKSGAKHKWPGRKPSRSY